MPTAHIKKLEEIRLQKKTLQEKEDRLKADIMAELSQDLIDSHALEVNYDILIGGILDVIKKAKAEDKITEAWKVAGEKFRQGKKKKHPQKNAGPSEKAGKPKGEDQ